jgi:drug/metabolite transporter (DMT)-like permease
MPFLGELAAIGTSLCYSIGSTLFTITGRQLGALLVNRARLLVAALVVMLLHLLTFGSLLPVDAGPERWFWLGLSSLFGLVLGDASLFLAFLIIGPRLAMLMMALAPVLSAILAWVFLGEVLSGMELLGIAITVGGIMLVVAERGGGAKTETVQDRRYIVGLLYGLGGAVGQAGGFVMSKIGLAGSFPALSAHAIRLLTACVVIWALAIVNRQLISSYKTLRAHPRTVMLLSGATLLGPVLGVWLSLVAVQNANVGVASALSSLAPIFLIPISYFVFKERITRQAVIGTLVTFIGIVILFL